MRSILESEIGNLDSLN